ncbi:MAG: hypothetical protein WEA80_13070 [Gemmatimonadaceae bacterium]
MAVFKKKGRDTTTVKKTFYYEKDGAEKMQMTMCGGRPCPPSIVSKMPDGTMRLIYGTRPTE